MSWRTNKKSRGKFKPKQSAINRIVKQIIPVKTRISMMGDLLSTADEHSDKVEILGYLRKAGFSEDTLKSVALVMDWNKVAPASTPPFCFNRELAQSIFSKFEEYSRISSPMATNRAMIIIPFTNGVNNVFVMDSDKGVVATIGQTDKHYYFPRMSNYILSYIVSGKYTDYDSEILPSLRVDMSLKSLTSGVRRVKRYWNNAKRQIRELERNIKSLQQLIRSYRYFTIKYPMEVSWREKIVVANEQLQKYKERMDVWQNMKDMIYTD